MQLSSISLTTWVGLLSGPLTALVTVYLSSKASEYKKQREVVDSLLHEQRTDGSLIESSIEKLKNSNIGAAPEKINDVAYEKVQSTGELHLFPYEVQSELASLYRTKREINSTYYGERKYENDEFIEMHQRCLDSTNVMKDYLSDYRSQWGYEYFLLWYFRSVKRSIFVEIAKLKFRIKSRICDAEEYTGRYRPPQTEIPEDELVFN